MSNDIWNTLRSRVEELPSNATHLISLSRKQFTVTEVRDSSLIVEYRKTNESDSLQREKLELLFSHIMDAPNGFDCDRLPPSAEPYATILSLHPQVHLDDQEGKMTETEMSPVSPLVNIKKETLDPSERVDLDSSVFE